MDLRLLSHEALAAMLTETRAAYEALQGKKLQLNMARGNPSPEQLALTMPMMSSLTTEDSLITETSEDCRNYGLLSGIPEARKLFAELLSVPADEVFVAGNSSLQLMFNCIQIAFTHGIAGCQPWHKQENLKFLCPVPGYDRHFAVANYFGLKLIPVPMREDGPDMDVVAEYVEKDADVKGIWCVPVYSNPTGVIYSDDVVRRFASLKPAAKDFRIFWDNAYCIHHIVDDPVQPLRITDACKAFGSEDMVYQFVSTSKVTFAGAGIAAVNMSKANLAQFTKEMGIQTIGFDKINQMRHARFFGDAAGVIAHMKKHAALLKPKFDVVIAMLEKELASLELGSWTAPQGGYFISYQAPKGCAKRIVQLCKEAGVTLTPAGATYPYGNDPDDSNIRIAPTYPSVAALQQTMELFCLCVKLAAIEKLIQA